MSENITVTGNKAQFNEDVVFLKDTDIRGSILFGETGTITTGLLNIDGDLATDNLLIREDLDVFCLLYTSPSPRDLSTSRMPSSA